MWHELASDLVRVTLAAHSPHTPRMMCPGCMAAGYPEMWPCAEAVHAANTLNLLDTLATSQPQADTPHPDPGTGTTDNTAIGIAAGVGVDEGSCTCPACLHTIVDDAAAQHAYSPPLSRCSALSWPPSPYPTRVHKRHHRRPHP